MNPQIRTTSGSLSENSTPWSRTVLEKLIVAQLVNKFPAFMEPKGSLPCSEEAITELYPETVTSRAHLCTLCIQYLL
jgi:hypothetical protein